jgi:hypothetical protein
MQFRILLTCLLFAGLTSTAQSYFPFDTSDSTVFIVDSVETSTGMNGLSPDKIAMINVVKGKKLQAKYGDRAANGVIYIETKPFARQRYMKMFAEVSPDYAAALKQYGSDSSFVYVLDGSPLTNSVEPLLAAVERKNIDNIKVKKTADKKVEILIQSK